MGRGKRIIISIGVCLILLVSVFGCVAGANIDMRFSDKDGSKSDQGAIHIIAQSPTATLRPIIDQRLRSLHFSLRLK